MSENDAMAQKQDVISLADEEGVKQVLVNSVLGLWDVVNDLTRLRPSRRDRYRVTIFGSARRRRERSATKRPSGRPPRWPRWAAT
jgi:hypothetical protein